MVITRNYSIQHRRESPNQRGPHPTRSVSLVTHFNRTPQREKQPGTKQIQESVQHDIECVTLPVSYSVRSGRIPVKRPMTNCKRVLFLCTGNSCRSQMAEGFLRELFGDRYESCSAGTNPAGYVHPKAIEVMKQCGIDLSSQASKDIADFLPPNGTVPDLIVGVCSSAAENCPVFPAAVEHRHWPFDDPAHATGTEEEITAEFVRVRDEIRTKLELEFGS